MSRGSAYLNWLHAQIKFPDGESYRGLSARLHDREFVWTVANDDNRLQDGIELRMEFGFDGQEWWSAVGYGCSALEVIVALSRRLQYYTGVHAEVWAWTLLENLSLHPFKDPLEGADCSAIDHVLDKLIYRTYKKNGEGSFFPLAFSTTNARRVEVWDQMCMYIEEQSPEWG